MSYLPCLLTGFLRTGRWEEDMRRGDSMRFREDLALEPDSIAVPTSYMEDFHELDWDYLGVRVENRRKFR
eukprot:3542783-Amphidinium_carterae.1